MRAGIKLYNVLSTLIGGIATSATEFTDKLKFTDGGNARIYPMFVPEFADQSPPYIVWQIVSSQPVTTYDGISGHEWLRIQIDVYDKDYDNCTLLANKVINLINTQIKPSIYDGQQQMYDSASGLYRQSIDYEFFQTTPTE